MDQEEVGTRATGLKDGLTGGFTTGFVGSDGSSNDSGTSSCQLSRDESNALQVLEAVFSCITELFFEKMSSCILERWNDGSPADSS